MIKKMILAVMVGMMAVGCTQATGSEESSGEYKHGVGVCSFSTPEEMAMQTSVKPHENTTSFNLPIKDPALAVANTFLTVTSLNAEKVEVVVKKQPSNFEINTDGTITAYYENCTALSGTIDWYYIGG